MAGAYGAIIVAIVALIPFDDARACLDWVPDRSCVADAACGSAVGAPQPEREGVARQGAIADEGEPAALRPKTLSPRAAVFRSVLYPGWGQLSNGKPYKACVVFGVETYFVGVAVLAGRRAQDLLDRSRFVTSETELADLERRYDECIDRRNAYLWWLGAAILYAMLDAYVDAGLADVEDDTAKPAPVFLESSTGDGGLLRFGIGARF